MARSARSGKSQAKSASSAAPGARSTRRYAWALLIPLVTAGVLVAILVWPRGGTADREELENGPPPVPEIAVPRIDRNEVSLLVYRALEESRDRVEQDPADADAWGELGQALYAHSLNDKALTCLEQAARLDPSDARWPYLSGMIVAERDRSLGLEAIERAVALEPSNFQLQLRLAEFYLDLQRYDDCRRLLGQAADIEPRHPRLLIATARVAAGEGDWESALIPAEAAYREAPRRADIVQLLAQIYLRLDRVDEARHLADQIENLPIGESWPDAMLAEVYRLRVDAATLSEEADRYLQQERFDEFYQAMERLIQLEPHEAQWHVWLARTLLRGQNLAGAAQVLDRGLARIPHSPELRFLRGVVANNLTEYQEAETHLRLALQYKPDYPEAHYHLAFSLAGQDRKPLAMESLRTVLVYEPSFAPAHLDLGELLLEEGQVEQAVEHLQRAVELAPESQKARSLLAEARGRQGQ